MTFAHFEPNNKFFDGTIIDLETIGNFRNFFNDSRRYSQITPVILGFINNEGIRIHCAKSIDSIEKLRKDIREVMKELVFRRPLFAFNTDFERGTLFHNSSVSIEFDGELNKERYESKRSAVQELGISNYDDPFHDNGRGCSLSWMRGQIDLAIAHNRSCLLKERDILLSRGFRKPQDLKLVEE
jgi:hypothetical protein